MKQLFSIFLASASLCLFTNCSDADFSDKYADPSKTSEVSCEKLMTGVFYAGKTFTTPEYWRIFTFDFQFLGRCAQTVGFINEKGRYAGGGETYFNDRWTHFYNTLAQYRLLEHTFNNLPEEKKDNYEIFVILSQIFLYEQLQEIIDLFGDVPFHEAGYLALTGDVKTAYPFYEKAEDLYEMMLDDLAVINDKLAGFEPSPLAGIYLPVQDYINKGDLVKWRKFANSLRLRMAMRIADNGSLTAKGRAILAEMLAATDKYPLVDNNDENSLIAADKDKFIVTKDSNTGIQSIESWAGSLNRASKTMISALQGDPRLEILYDPNSDGEYVGIDSQGSETEQNHLMERPTSEGGIYYSAIDTATFSRNAEFPGLLITAAEVSFIKAEAFLKGYATGNAQEAFETAVTQSIDLYFRINATATYRQPTPKPTGNDIAAFVTQKWEAYESKEEAVRVQKWLHFSLLDMIEAWNHIRRTGIPELTFTEDMESIEYPHVFQRLRYPTDERNNNSDKYAAYQAEDSYYGKIFWAK
ncbi:MAG: SusD/RagB family nutrient-binding outer membrane lipoprotein [Tannerellaceae bacterium]|jgi:hypothetical protein|nr:SusD/RagB family nutrient-binding outer membrane lipoprotein [Tannerellaceae bacterium]